ncbi:MAG: hypothetical protein ACREDP_22025, partial [Bradyrhizobium sp.]
MFKRTRTFSSEVDTGSRQENASKQRIQSRFDSIETRLWSVSSEVDSGSRQECASIKDREP